MSDQEPAKRKITIRGIERINQDAAQFCVLAGLRPETLIVLAMKLAREDPEFLARAHRLEAKLLVQRRRDRLMLRKLRRHSKLL